VRRQTAEEQLISFMRGAYGSQAGSEIPEKELQAAKERVGAGRSEKQLRWAISFAEEPYEKMSLGDQINAQIEIGVFLQPSLPFAKKGARKSVPFVAALFPSREQLEKIKKEFRLLIQHSAAGTEHSFNVAEMEVHVGHRAVSYGAPQNLSDPARLAQGQIDAAKLELAHLLAAHWKHIAICDRKRHGCGHYFVRSRTDQIYCSKRCLNRATTYRARGKEPLV
jgi:hypothetical protein